MKTKISAFIAAIILLLGATNIIAQNAKISFNKDGKTVYESAIAGIDSIVFKQVPDLSEEEAIEFYTNFEDFTNSPDFQSYNTIDGSKSALSNWLRQQPNVEDVTIGENVLTLTFKGGAKTEIEVLEPVEEQEYAELEYEPEKVDADYFTGSALQNIFTTEHSNTTPQPVMRSIAAFNEPNYISPVFWEPYSPKYSIVSIMDRYYKPERIPFLRMNKLKYQDAQCNPFELRSALMQSYTIGNQIIKPNLIFFTTHGDTDALRIGCCLPSAYEKIRADLKNIGITISGLTQSMSTQPRCYIFLRPADLYKLLQGVNLSNSIVFLNACMSQVGENLSKVFTDLGANCVFGYQGEIEFPSARDITDILLQHLLIPISVNSEKKVTANVLTAYNNVRLLNILHVNRLQLYSTQSNYNFKFQYPPISTTSGRPIVPPLRSSNATQEQGVEVFGGLVHYYSPAPGYSKSYYGFVYSSTTNNPKVNDGKSNLVDYELDHEIFDDEIYALSSNHDIEYNKQYYYRAFVASIYNGIAYIYYADEVEPFMVEGEIEDILNLSPNELNFVKEGETKSFSIETNLTNISVSSSNSSWCHVPSTVGATKIVNVIVDKNETLSPRTAKITVATSNATKNGTVTVTQEAGDPYLNFIPEALNIFKKEGGTQSFKIETNLTIERIFSMDDTWCHVPPTVDDTKTVTVKVDKNETTKSRNTIIWVDAIDPAANVPSQSYPMSIQQEKGEEEDGDWVLIDGVPWATRNVGAPGTFMPDPENYGWYYRWGVNPCPPGYHLPTADEINRLLYSPNVSYVWTSIKGVPGRQFTDNTTKKSIFLPAAGFAWDDIPYYQGEIAYYWSVNQYSDECGWCFGFDNLNGGGRGLDKAYQITIRPVKN